MLRLGLSSREIDDDMWKKDIELLITLDDIHTEKEIRKLAIAVGKALAGDFK